MQSHWVLLILASILTIGFVLERWLNFLNLRAQRSVIPAELKDVYAEEDYRKSLEYERTNSNFESVTSSFNYVLTMALLFSGFFAWLDQWSRNTNTDLVWSTLLFFGILALFADIISMPFALYKTFVIEEKFNFNRTTLKLFFTDKLKGYILAIVLGGSLLAMFVLFYQLAGKNFWWYAWITFSLVSVFLSMFYASLILPMFNKLKPLEEGKLRSSIEAYCSSVKFQVDNLFVMDGSRRSAKANAFFSGLGARKKIVLFDTLVEKHTQEELVAILAHEIGHYKKKHTLTGMILTILQTGLMLYLLSYFINLAPLSEALGGTGVSLTLGLLAFGILYTPISMILAVIMNLFSRKHEYEADAYASNTYSGTSLQSALKKLSADNLSNLTPHPWYVFFYYSHPTLLQRIRALSRLQTAVTRVIS